MAGTQGTAVRWGISEVTGLPPQRCAFFPDLTCNSQRENLPLGRKSDGYRSPCLERGGKKGQGVFLCLSHWHLSRPYGFALDFELLEV